MWLEPLLHVKIEKGIKFVKCQLKKNQLKEQQAKLAIHTYHTIFVSLPW